MNYNKCHQTNIQIYALILSSTSQPSCVSSWFSEFRDHSGVESIERMTEWMAESWKKFRAMFSCSRALQACKIFLLCENLLLNSKLTEETNEGGKLGFRINGILLSGKAAYPRRGYRVWSKNISQHYVTSLTTHSSILAWRIPWTKRSLAGYSPWGHKVLGTTEQLTLDVISHLYDRCCIRHVSVHPFYPYCSPTEQKCVIIILIPVLKMRKLRHKLSNFSADTQIESLPLSFVG